MIVSTHKTDSLVVSKDPILYELKIELKMIELSIFRDSNRNTYEKAIRQVMKAARISGYLKYVYPLPGKINKYLRLEFRVKV